MKKTWLVLRNEIINTLTRRSFLFTTFGLPLIGALIFFGISLFNQTGSGSAGSLSLLLGTSSSEQTEGLVDSAGIIREIPETISSDRLRQYQDEEAAQVALEQGLVAAYYIIPEDFLEKGEIVYIRPDFSPLQAFSQTGLIDSLVAVNLLGGDEQLAALIAHPLVVTSTPLAEASTRDEDNPLTFFLPYGTTLIFYMIILMSSSLLLSSVTKEKENRVIEVLLASAAPRQLISGKIVGLGLVGLLQAAAWIGTSYTLLRLSGRTFDVPPSFQLPFSFLVWGVIFFILGFAIYASLMAGIGTLVPSLREASQATFLVILPLLIPLMMVGVLIQDPHGTLAVGFSLFPLTSPVVMMTRLAAGGVPLWQILLSVGLLIVSAVLLMRAVADLFHAQTLLSGQPFSLHRLANALTGRGRQVGLRP